MFTNSKSDVEIEFSEIDANSSWPHLFQHIRSECLNYEYTVSEAKKTHNKNLNRYRDVSPYDHSRVVLSKGSCDYINANLVTMERAHRRYILTQGPLPNTIGHFWLMVWEQNCKAVLMLNKIVEKKQVKCHQYWPMGGPIAGVDDVLVLNDVGLKVQYISSTAASYYTVTVLRLTELESGNSREILHFHYTTWPDFGVPQSPTAFLDFLMVVRKSGVLDQNVGPPVVHCSAGIGRSGTFCLVDSCLVLIEENGIEALNVREVLLEMRKYRMGLIQTPDQLRFSYLAIIEGAKKLRSSMNNSISGSIELDVINTNYTKNAEANNILEEEDESEEPPPLPPPRGESLTRSVMSDFQNNSTDNHVYSSSQPPDKPLPVEPPSYQEGEASPSLKSPNDCAATSADESSHLITSTPSSPESSKESDRTSLRQRVRKERMDQLAAKLREMKRKQEAAEGWQRMKRSSKKQKRSEAD
ncbi:tyrosine-protein phosphatase non-receptor type 2 isoform X2 [Anabrus simplex]|uniref:tyrosine-protein phosphatase non-receptor type 2 isoform X2 n=1 Tax=Anabrus simplex TaxID=316456 RepID=UPI0035A3D2C3